MAIAPFQGGALPKKRKEKNRTRYGPECSKPPTPMAYQLSDEDDDTEPYFTPITNPIIKKYGHLLWQMLVDFRAETQHCELNRDQIDQFASCIETFRTLVVMEEDLSELDGMLRLFFAREYYSPDDNVASVLVNNPTGTEN